MLGNKQHMAKRSTVLFIAVLTLSFFSLCISLPQCAGAASSLTIEVRHQLSEAPIAGATVSISGPSIHSAVTGADGKVTFTNIPSGDYRVVISVSTYPNTAAQTITVNGKTTTIVLFAYTKAYFDYLPQHPLTNDTISFNATKSSSSGNITSYDWNFGDGETGTGLYPNHHYVKSGSYTVLLTVTSTVGRATYNQLIQVGTVNEDVPIFPWILLLIPFLIPLILFLRRRRHYVIIQARVPLRPTHPHCPGDGTKCEDCKMAPC